jgi:hypothetical protein
MSRAGAKTKFGKWMIAWGIASFALALVGLSQLTMSSSTSKNSVAFTASPAGDATLGRPSESGPKPLGGPSPI